MVFYNNENDLSEKILEFQEMKLRRSIARKGKQKYMRYFNSNKVAKFIIEKTLEIKSNEKYYWKN